MKEWMTPQQVADYTSFALRTLKRWRVQKSGPAYWSISSKAVRYLREDVDRWMESRQRIPCDEPSPETEMKKNSPDLVSKKIKVLRHEGVPEKQAIATAISMGKAGRITKSGGYRRVGREKSK